MQNLSNYDLLFGLILILSMLLALIRGGIAEILSLSVWFISLFIIHHYSTELAKFIPYSINNLLIRSLLIDLIIFVCVSITLKIIRKILVSLLKSIGLGGINYLLGAVFGFIRGVFISAVFIIILEILHLDNSHSWQHSHFSGVIKPTIQILLSSLPNDLINFKDHANNYQNYYHLIKQVQH